MKKLLSAMMMAGAMVFASAVLVATPAMTQEAKTLDAMEAEIEALLIANADDPDAFAAAVEAYVLAETDAELATEAVINVLTRPQIDPALKRAGGNGLGAAIAQIGLTNPTLAANMQAKVAASDDAILQAAVTEGTDMRTASISINAQAQQDGASDPSRDSTPETPVSPN
jgi:hypothetical protein